MKQLLLSFFVLGLITKVAVAADAVHPRPIKVITTVTELAWLAGEIGKDHVEAEALLNGTENPHFIDAVPSFIQKTSSADIVLLIGLELEIGWMPKVLARSGNAKVQPGGRGYIEVGKSVELLGKPSGPVDRSMGDVHPGGNPHFWLSPTAMIQASQAVVDALSDVAPRQVQVFLNNRKAFVTKMKMILENNRKKFAEVGFPQPWLMEYHQEFTYFLKDYNLKSYDSVEEKPGVPPSAGRLAQVSIAAKRSGVKVLLTADFAPKRTVERFSELSGIPAAIVPTSIRKSGKFSNYEVLQNFIVDTLISTANGKVAE